jgi:hypothetical protein
MNKIRISEETSTRIVLEMVNPMSAIWKEWKNNLINPLLFLVVSYVILLWQSVSLNWVYWTIAIGVLLIEAFFLYNVLTSERTRIVTIDLLSRRATRIEKLIIGREKKQELALEEVSRVLIHREEAGHQAVVALESQSYPLLKIAHSYDLQETSFKTKSKRDQSRKRINDGVFEIKSLDMLGRKLGGFLNKPVVNKLTDMGKIVSQETIQP